jgi:hemolysin activation/secretion protein
MDTVELVNLAIAGDKDALETAFNNAMAAKVTDALEIKKVELASNLLSTEETDETTNATIEADGTDGSTDIQHEPTAEESADTEQN